MTCKHKEPVVTTLLKEDDEYLRMQLSLALYKPRQEVVTFITSAYNSHEYDWRQSDGCTAVSEVHFPAGYRFPPCVAHDYYCWLSRRAPSKAEADRIRAEGDRLFRLANMDYGVSGLRSCLRYAGVRLAYYAWYRWFIKGDGRSRCGGCGT